jgi:hypothetical protein
MLLFVQAPAGKVGGWPASNRCVGVCAYARIVAEMSPRGGLSEVLYLLSKGLASSGFRYQKGRVGRSVLVLAPGIGIVVGTSPLVSANI